MRFRLVFLKTGKRLDPNEKKSVNAKMESKTFDGDPYTIMEKIL